MSAILQPEADWLIFPVLERKCRIFPIFGRKFEKVPENHPRRFFLVFRGWNVFCGGYNMDSDDMPTHKQGESTPVYHDIMRVLERADAFRHSSKYRADANRRSQIGQFLTPVHVAELMASLFELKTDAVRLLDPGAGAGILAAAVIMSLARRDKPPKAIHITAYENDDAILPLLQHTLEDCSRVCRQAGINCEHEIVKEDFIQSGCEIAGGALFTAHKPKFNAVVLNPPYKKIASDSTTRSALRKIGIEATNLYSAFMALSALLLDANGEMVTITPRSFCNGPYFRAFRRFFFERMALTHLHVFNSRSVAFSGDEVLQENVILHSRRAKQHPATVTISTSNGDGSETPKQVRRSYSDVIAPEDPDGFIHIVADMEQAFVREQMSLFTHSLEDLGLSVSTGRVVDFRATDFIKTERIPGVVPLIYPCHFGAGFIVWPKSNSRKPNYILNDTRSESLLVESGVYVLVKRFSAKEEKRRITSCIYDPRKVRAKRVGFENHLNYYHAKGQGIPRSLAKGLVAFLNSRLVDIYFRQFNGHTQVNASDLRKLRYPSREALVALGKRINGSLADEKRLNELVEEMVIHE